VFEELNQNKSSHWLIDGFPRNVDQAKSLDQFCKLTAVIDLLVPHEEIIDRIKGRLIHESSGRVYNTEFKPPLVAGKDDETGEPLVQRLDDRPDAVKARLVAYDQQTAPVLKHYEKQGLLHQFMGTTSKQIYTELKPFLQRVTSCS
jgi:adenylate kinase family enzyme